MRTFFALVLMALLAPVAFGQHPMPQLSMPDRIAAPGSVIRMDVALASAVPVRSIDLAIRFSSDTLRGRSGFWLKWWTFEGWLTAEYATSDSIRVAMASRRAFLGSSPIGSFRMLVSDFAAPGTSPLLPRVTGILNDTISVEAPPGVLVVGPRVIFGDVNGNGRVTAGDVVALLDIILPDSFSVAVPIGQQLAADVSGDGILDTWDGWQILYKVVNPNYYFDVEDTEGLKGSTTMPGNAAPIVLEECSNGVMLRRGSTGDLWNGLFVVKANMDIADAMPSSTLTSTAHKVARTGKGISFGFVSLVSLPENAELMFFPNVHAADLTVEGTVNEGIPIKLEVSRVTYAEGEDVIPSDFSLSQNYPNPFNPTTAITFALPVAGPVSLIAYNVLGEAVATIAEGEHAAGTHTVHFNASALPSGTYIYRLRANGTMLSRKMVLLR